MSKTSQPNLYHFSHNWCNSKTCLMYLFLILSSLVTSYIHLRILIVLTLKLHWKFHFFFFIICSLANTLVHTTLYLTYIIIVLSIWKWPRPSTKYYTHKKTRLLFLQQLIIMILCYSTWCLLIREVILPKTAVDVEGVFRVGSWGWNHP